MIPGAGRLRAGPAAERITARLAAAGFPEPDVDATDLMAAAGDDDAWLSASVQRRLDGEPIEWITGTVGFMGLTLAIGPGVYVPRRQTELLVGRALHLLPPAGVAVDLATGCGAVAAALRAGRPGARVLATDIDPESCRWARRNGVDARQGHLADPLPAGLDGACDLLTAVVPYVPTGEMQYLPRDVRRHEPALALDGGPAGTRLLAEAVAAAGRLLAPGGGLVLEVGGRQDIALTPLLRDHGFGPPDRVTDDDGDLRAVAATRL